MEQAGVNKGGRVLTAMSERRVPGRSPPAADGHRPPQSSSVGSQRQAGEVEGAGHRARRTTEVRGPWGQCEGQTGSWLAGAEGHTRL